MSTTAPTSRAAQYSRAASDIVAGLARWRRGDLSGEGTYMVMRRLHRRSAGRSSRLALTVLRSMPGSPERADRGRPLDPAWAAAVERVRVDGLSRVPDALDPDAVSRVTEFARTAPGTRRANDGTSSSGTYAGAEPDVTAVHVQEPFVLGNADIQGLIASPVVAAFATRYFGASVVIHPPQLYWSLAAATPLTPEVEVRNARRFHWDYDGIAGLRLHLNLTAVDEHAAPMQYLVGSHRPGRLDSRALRHADLGTSDDDVWRSFGPGDLRSLIGPAGSTFVSDSQGLHRGTQPERTDRLFLVLPMQATAFAGYQLRPRTITPAHPDMIAGLERGRPELRLFTAG